MCLHFLTHRQKKRACVCMHVCVHKEREREWMNIWTQNTYISNKHSEEPHIFSFIESIMQFPSDSHDCFPLVWLCASVNSAVSMKCSNWLEVSKNTCYAVIRRGGGGGGGKGREKKRKKRHWSAPNPKFHPWNSESNVMCVRAGERERVNIETCVNWH